MALPNAKYLLIKNKTLGIDPLVDKILGTNPQDEELRETFSKARTIYLSQIRKRYVESCLLASKDLGEISEILEIPVDVLYLYEELFFHVLNLDKLSLLEIVDSVSNMEERGMYMWALAQGLDFVRFRLGLVVKTKPVEGLEELLTICTFKAKEAAYTSNISESSKQAVNWVKLAADLAKIVKTWTVDASAARSDIEMALQSIVPDFEGFQDLDS